MQILSLFLSLDIPRSVLKRRIADFLEADRDSCSSHYVTGIAVLKPGPGPGCLGQASLAAVVAAVATVVSLVSLSPFHCCCCCCRRRLAVTEMPMNLNCTVHSMTEIWTV